MDAENQMLSERVVLALIGLATALVGWIINQLVLKRWEAFKSENKAIALERLEKAYRPLYYLTGMLLQKGRTGEDTSLIRHRISDILEKHGHLLTLDVENMTIAYLFLKNADLNILDKERLKLAMEIETLKNLVYPNYKLYEDYFTASIFGKIKVFWEAVQYRIFSLVVIATLLALAAYLVVQNIQLVASILMLYILIGTIWYLVRNLRKANRLRKGLIRTTQKTAQTKSDRVKKPTASQEDPTKPSATLTDFSNSQFQISYPDNFETMFPMSKAGTEFSMELRGTRQDCTIHIDILPAKGRTVGKVIEQNSKFYKPTSRGSTTIDGASTIYFDYSPAKNIDSRVYFLVKNDKVYRLIFNIYQPLKTDYLLVFEKTVASLKIK